MRVGMNNDSAVSEVLGVMLMISVTLIIVAIVAVYATGSASDTRQPIRADLIATADATTEIDKNGDTWYQVIFDHRSGDPFNVDQVQVSIGSRENLTVHTLLGNEQGAGKQYIETFARDDRRMVLLGDRFKVSIGEYDRDAKVILLGEGREIKCGEHLTYRFIDRRTGSPISSGEVLIRKPPG